VLALGRVARDQHPPRPVGAIRVAVVRHQPVEQDRLTGLQFNGCPAEVASDVFAHDTAVVGRENLVDPGGEPEASGLRRARVDRDEDRHHARHAGICDAILVRTKAGPAGLLVVDLVLERDHRFADRIGCDVAERAVDERGNPVVARRHVLGSADRRAGGGRLGVVAPDVTTGRPGLDLGCPFPEAARRSLVEHRYESVVLLPHCDSIARVSTSSIT
jgi:hypothetical protein